MSRILGLDYGTKTVGVAVSDALGLTAQAVETITRKEENKLRKTYARIEAIIEEYDVDTLVVGLPKNMNNTEGERAESTRKFCEDLERRTGLPVILFDERLTTMASDRILEAEGMRKKERKTYIDQMAAQLILQSYMDQNRKNG